MGKSKNENSGTETGDALPSGTTQPSKEEQVQKKTYLWLIVFGVAVLGLGVWNVGHELNKPFAKPKTTTNSTQNQTSGQTNQVSAVNLEDLRTKDTDKDGLSDYDELYVYSTSPYLSDTDSDGIADGTEVKAGTDPNCPTGQTCTRQTANTNTSNSAGANANGNANSNLTNASLLDINPQDLTASQLRDILRSNGVSDTDLSKVSDADLMAVYQQVLSEQGYTNTNATTNTNTVKANTTNVLTNGNTNQTVTLQDLQSLSVADIRYLLEQGGIPKATLDQVDDSTLQSIYLQSLTNNASQLQSGNANSKTNS